MQGRLRKKPALFLFWVVTATALTAPSACQDVQRAFLGARRQAEGVAERAGMAPNWYRAGMFELRGFERFGQGRLQEPLVVYIESDGQAWVDRETLSPDPTPVRPIVLDMAVRDQAPAVLYLARPCQYLDETALQRCGTGYWSDARFAPEVIAAMDEAVSQALRRSGRTRLILVGYSGGGVVAALLAARRTDISRFITIASPLDHATWTSLHQVSPLSRSLNPVNEAARLSPVPQVHFVGEKDTIVPASVLRGYVARLSDPGQAPIIVVPGQTHTCCWADIWPDLLARHIPRAEAR